MWTYPYGHAAIIAVLRAVFFSTSSQAGRRFANEFKSSIPEKPNELEIPIPMVAMAATVVRGHTTRTRPWFSNLMMNGVFQVEFALTCWVSGEHVAAKFGAESTAKLYEGHISYMDTVYSDCGPAKFHRLLVNVLTACRSVTCPYILVLSDQYLLGLVFLMSLFLMLWLMLTRLTMPTCLSSPDA